jgi:L-fucose mutarotase
MLKGIDPLLGPDLLHALAAMGHGDELVIADANFPAAAMARRLVRLDGVSAPRALAAILTLLPLDTFTEMPASVMAVVGDPEAVPPAVREFQPLVDAASPRESLGSRAPGGGASAPRRPEARKPGRLERFAFYERARAAFAVVATGDTRAYANIVLTKGVVVR